MGGPKSSNESEGAFMMLTSSRRIARLVAATAGVSCLMGGLLVATTASLAGAKPLARGTLYVTETGVDTGTCTNPTTPCASLGYAYSEATDSNTISVGPGAFEAEVTITKDLTIVGAGKNATQLYNSSGNVLTVEGPKIVMISNLTIYPDLEGSGLENLSGNVNLSNVVITYGANEFGGDLYTDGGSLSMTGGALSFGQAFAGGGIFSDDSSVSLKNVTLNHDSGQFGGGIFNEGPISVTDSDIINNDAYEAGAGILTAGKTTLTSDQVQGNEAGSEGGGVFVEFGTTTVNHTVVTSNHADTDGGGIETCSAGSLIAGPGASIEGNTPNNISAADPNDDCEPA
jgi:hypothetical protein